MPRFNTETIHPAIPEILRNFREAGFFAFLVGGCVRDLLLGRAPNDYDLTTQATPDEVRALFPDRRVVSTGETFGTVTLFWDGEPFEITTFRREGAYRDHRRPDTLTFGQTIEEDLERRDFTINALAWNPRDGLIDPHGGAADLERGILRAVGDPRTRFREDYLRLWRALRFALRFDLTLEADTRAALIDLIERGDIRLPAERLAKEWREILTSPELPGRLAREPFWYRLLPRLDSPVRPDLAATELILPATPLPFREEAAFWAAWLTIACHSERTFFLTDSLKSLALPRDLAHRIKLLLGEPPAPRDDTAVLRALRGYGRDDLRLRLDYEIDFRETFGLNAEPYRDALARVDAMLAGDPCYSLRQLRINGNYLSAIGFSGDRIGRALDDLLAEVISGKIPNDPKALRERAGEMYEED